MGPRRRGDCNLHYPRAKCTTGTARSGPGSWKTAGPRQRPGAGARFATPPARRDVARSTGMNILIIDDEPSLRRTLRTALEAMGHHATEARDGPQALELAGHRQFDLAFLDLRLGGAA